MSLCCWRPDGVGDLAGSHTPLGLAGPGYQSPVFWQGNPARSPALPVSPVGPRLTTSQPSAPRNKQSKTAERLALSTAARNPHRCIIHRLESLLRSSLPLDTPRPCLRPAALMRPVFSPSTRQLLQTAP